MTVALLVKRFKTFEEIGTLNIKMNWLQTRPHRNSSVCTACGDEQTLLPTCFVAYLVDTVQDFLIKLGIKPRLHICIENKHFFNKPFHHQTYKNYEQPPQSLQNLYFQSHFLAYF